MKTTKNIILVGSLLSCLCGAYATEADVSATTEVSSPEQAQLSGDAAADTAQTAPSEPKTAEEFYEIGYSYYKLGPNKDTDFFLAADYFRKAAELGHAEAQKMLGYCYYFTEEPETAAVWVRQSAEQGNAEAQVALGKFYFEGSGVKKDVLQAFAWFRKASEQGCGEAWYYLGLCYETYRLPGLTVLAGIGIDSQDGKAFECYQKAAEKGVAAAQFRLAHCYMYGRGVEKNEEEAFKLYEKVSNRVEPLGLNLSPTRPAWPDARTEWIKCYLYGKGVKQDMKKAFDEIAIATGLRKFDANIGGQKVKISLPGVGAASPYVASPEARYTLAKCLLYGWGCEQDKKEAKKLLESLGNYRAAKAMLKAH